MSKRNKNGKFKKLENIKNDFIVIFEMRTCQKKMKKNKQWKRKGKKIKTAKVQENNQFAKAKKWKNLYILQKKFFNEFDKIINLKILQCKYLYVKIKKMQQKRIISRNKKNVLHRAKNKNFAKYKKWKNMKI